MNAKATLYLDPKLLKAAKIKAAHTEHSLSYLVNEALRMSFKDDTADYEAFEKRGREPARRLSTVLKDLKEMAGIRADKRLVARLKAGSAAARKKMGDFRIKRCPCFMCLN
jgi:hypothetical protein